MKRVSGECWATTTRQIHIFTDNAGSAGSLGLRIRRSRGVPGIGAWIILPNLALLDIARIEATNNVDFPVTGIVGDVRAPPEIRHWRACGPAAAGHIVNVSGVEDGE